MKAADSAVEWSRKAGDSSGFEKIGHDLKFKRKRPVPYGAGRINKGG